MNKVLQFLTGDFFKAVGGIIDDVVTTKAEKEELRQKLYSTILDAANQSEELQAEIIRTEATGNTLQRNWRPLVMLAFCFIVVFHYFLYPVFLAFVPSLPILPVLTVDFWTLLQIGIGGYVVGRTAEKIIPQINFKKNANI